jgi:UDP-N-acetylglucosamine 3-dehydrogenase
MVQTAVIGLGSMGINHARVYTELPQARLVAVADTDPSVLAAAADRFNVPVYQDYRQLLQKERPEAVSVAVPTALHEAVATYALESGADVLVEKPIAATLAEGQRLIERARALGRQLMVGHIVRFNPATQLLKQKLQAGELGRVFQIVCRRTGPFPARVRDVGVVIDLAPHDLDIMRFLTGTEPLRLYAEIGRRIHTAHEDLMLGVIRFPDGITGLLEINWLTPTKVRELLVLGERGMFLVNDLTQDLYFYENAQANSELWSSLRIIKGVSEGQMIRYAVRREEPLKAELGAFLKAVATGQPVPVTGEDGLAALRLALALVASGENHQLVELATFG